MLFSLFKGSEEIRHILHKGKKSCLSMSEVNRCSESGTGGPPAVPGRLS